MSDVEFQALPSTSASETSVWNNITGTSNDNTGKFGLDVAPLITEFQKNVMQRVWRDYTAAVVPKYKTILKFGQNENVGTASQVTVMNLLGSETEETYDRDWETL